MVVAPEVKATAVGNAILKVKEAIGEKIRKYLTGHTVIIWGSGATMPLGFPSMGELLSIFSRDNDFNGICNIYGNGFEEKLSKFLQGKKTECVVFEDKACKKIGGEFRKCENRIDNHNEKEYLEAMYGLYSFVSKQNTSTSSTYVDILTTNYDCSWERLFNSKGIPFLDGFQNNKLDYSAFFGGESSSVRIVKIHGSDNWFRYDTKDSYVAKVRIGEVPEEDAKCMSPKIIIPSNMKYEDVSKDKTFSNLMLAFGRLVKEADSYLTIGFGFNDLHLTPLLKQEAEKGKPVIRLMKEITQGGRVFAESVPTIITLSGDDGMSSVFLKERGETYSFDVFDDNLWSLPSFVKLLTEQKQTI